MTGQRILVIGGSSGIGLGVAKAAREAGAEVIIASRTRGKLDAAASQIPGGVETTTVDATDEGSVRRLMESCGEIDHLVTSIAAGAMGAFADLDMTLARRAFDAKFWCQATAAEHAAPKIRAMRSPFVTGTTPSTAATR